MVTTCSPRPMRAVQRAVVDEMQSMPGVDYETMLSELGKFGASFILATQSLAKLSDLSRTMQDTLLANIGCLCVFQVAGADARTLVWELGKDRVSEDDITSLPVHHCYVRATVGTERMPAFSMLVRKPEPGSPETAARIRAATSRYTTSAQETADRRAEAQKLAEQYRAEMAALEDGGNPPSTNGAAPAQERPDSDSSDRGTQRSKHYKANGKAAEDSPDGERGGGDAGEDVAVEEGDE